MRHVMMLLQNARRLVEERCNLSRYLKWTFVSCEGPMKVSKAVRMRRGQKKRGGVRKKGRM